jgi:L-cystine uptake protein TcyP (sodium:dicarboxylate symporter family)
MIVVKIIINLLVFAAALFGLRTMAKKFVKFPIRVMTALGLGILLGILLRLAYKSSEGSDIIETTITWISLVGSGYVKLLQMIVMPLIVVSIIGAVLNLKQDANVAKTSLSIISILVITTAIAAAVGIAISLFANLQAPDITTSATEARQAYLASRADAGKKSIVAQILDMFPANPFLDLTGARSTSTIAVVIISAFFAVATRQIAKKKEESFNHILSMTNALHDVVMRMVTIILRLTPYGVMALIVNMIAGSDWEEIFQLLKFVLASYAALIIMFIIHLVIIAANGLSPVQFIRKAWPALLTGFLTRSSAGSISINVKTQTEEMGVEAGAANMSASLGATIGQNGCAGIYPAMLAIMSMVTLGLPIDAPTIVKLILVIAVSSFGVAGVGGGATFAAIIVLSIMGLPVTLAGLLIAVEPLIDMGRTALNVSDAMLAGVITSKRQKTLNKELYNNSEKVTVDTID